METCMTPSVESYRRSIPIHLCLNQRITNLFIYLFIYLRITDDFLCDHTSLSSLSLYFTIFYEKFHERAPYFL